MSLAAVCDIHMDDPLLLARWQFAITTVYHFIFVPLTLGLAPLVAILQTFYYRTQDESYRRLTEFFGKLFIINFTLGVVTGIVQEFQFGMNWSEYSRFVGDIFGIPLAIEALLAFFLESTFLGLWIFGRERLSKRVHLLCIWLVAIGSNLSAIWILIANSWMQVPVGYAIRNGRAELTDFVAIVLNERVLAQAPHTILAGWVTGGLFVLGISAWHLLRGSEVQMFRKSAHIALVFSFGAALLTATTGHGQAQDTVRSQPMKIAAMEGLWETEQPASFSLFAIHDQDNRRSERDLRVPYLLSILSHNNATAEVRGINQLQAEAEATFGPGDYIPPVAPVYWSFRAMVGFGLWFLAVTTWGLISWWLNRLERDALWHRLALGTLFMPFLANTAGWMVTELGRQPWIVYGLLRTEQGVSPIVGPLSVWVTMGGFTLVYAALAAVGFFLMYRFARPGSVAPAPEAAGVAQPSPAY
jgi:cytochrome bd ubiquinol oxidase subunit I